MSAVSHQTTRPSSGSQAQHPVLHRLTALDARRRDEVACALSLLWDEFVSEIGGPAAWERRSKGEQGQYIRFLGLAAERIRLQGGSDKEHYALAPELMGLYAHALRVADPSRQDREVAAVALALAARGEAMRKVRSNAPEQADATPEAAA